MCLVKAEASVLRLGFCHVDCFTHSLDQAWERRSVHSLLDTHDDMPTVKYPNRHSIRHSIVTLSSLWRAGRFFYKVVCYIRFIRCLRV